MITLPKLTVVIPSYNQGQFIERTIKSVIDQGYPNLELILMDGGSTDETMAIVERYRDHFAHIQSGKDGGQSAAIAAGFERATGKFISWLNSDDTYNPGALLAIGRHLAAHPDMRFIYGNATIIDADDRLVAHKRSIAFNLQVMKYAFLTIPQMCAFWSRDLYREVGGVDAALKFCMDYDLFVRLASRTQPARIDVDVGNFRVHGDSKTSTLELVRQSEDRLVHSRYCAIKPGSVLFVPTRFLWTAVTVVLFALNGSLWSRLQRRMGNSMQSECS